jgi:DsbC/DsbD-like thiol-disulfide interchange protein
MTALLPAFARRLAFGGLLAATPLAALALEASPWVVGFHSKARLVEGGAGEGSTRLAGLELALDRGYKTYWRTPGEAGLPPSFDWSGSQNLKAVEVLWPAPRAFSEAGAQAFGYVDGVLLPIRVTPEREEEPVRLVLAVAYGVCKEICIPAEARIRLDLDPPRSSLRAGPVARALARVPAQRAMGEGDALAILAVGPGEGGPLTVRARAPTGAELFVEGPEGWSFLARPAAAGVYTVEVLQRGETPAAGLSLTMTLVAGPEAIETRTTLDRLPPPR